MNKTLIFRKIGGIISELTEQYQYLAESPENINPLELELFIANSHFLAEHLAILKKLESSPELLSQNSSVDQPSVEHPATSVPAAEIIALPVQEESLTSGVIVEDERNRPDIKEETEWFKPMQHEELAAEEEQSIPENSAEPVHIPEVQTPFAQERNTASSSAGGNQADDIRMDNIYHKEDEIKKAEPLEKVPTLNEILSEGMNRENIAAKIIQQEERDLKSMIKLNDKLMFIRDLFGGYSLAYSEAIELVNRFDTFEAAENFLKQNYAVKNKWSEKQGTVDQLYEILNRRFS